MKAFIALISICTMAFALVACDNMKKRDVGVITGGVVGGVVGSQFGGGSGRIAATAAGAIIGALIGGKVGSSMDRQDQYMMQQSIANNQIGQTSNWSNAQNGNQYWVTPVQSYRNSNGEPCRRYKTRAMIGGRMKTVWGQACRNAAGEWYMAN